MSHRTWFPFILIGATVAFILFVSAFWEPTVVNNPKVGAVSSTSPIELAPTNEEYQSEVTSSISSFITSNDADGAYEELLKLKVPADYKDFHLDLVVAIGSYRLGDRVEGEARLDLLRKDNPWLP